MEANRSRNTYPAYCYPRSLLEGKCLAVAGLDHVLYKEVKPEVTYYCPSTGNKLSVASYKLALQNAIDKIYSTTDHAPFSFYPDPDVKVAYVSLDNSVKSNNNGHSLWSSGRLDKICEIVNKIDADIVFFSEACRKSDVSWITMRCRISALTGLSFCMESTNNFSKDCMSFGVAMFAKNEILQKIESIQAHKLLDTDINAGCWGSGSVVVQLISKTVLVGCHFPVDFKRKGSDNLVGKAMQSLVSFLETYDSGKAYGFGDMNTIGGVMSESVDDSLKNKSWKLTNDCLTFLASYYDEAGNVDDMEGELTNELMESFF